MATADGIRDIVAGPSTRRRDRSAFGYMEPEGNNKQFAQCATCYMWIKRDKRCFWLGDTEVKATDSCIMYVEGEPIMGPATSATKLTPKEAGFFRGAVRCENCVSSRNNKCMLFTGLNEDQPTWFDLDPNIKPQGCCNAFAPRK